MSPNVSSLDGCLTFHQRDGYKQIDGMGDEKSESTKVGETTARSGIPLDSPRTASRELNRHCLHRATSL